MRIFTFILLLLFQGIALFASAEIAVSSEDNYTVSFSEEATASWERESDAILWGERVISDFRNKKENFFSMNSLCSSGSFEKLISLKKLSADIILSSVTSGKGTGSLLIAGKILSMMDAVFITPLTHRERELLAAAEEINYMNDDFINTGAFAGEIPSPEYAALPGVITLTAPQVNLIKHSPGKKRDIPSGIKKLQCRKNLFDNEFADLYRLFLYVRDNSGNAKTFHLTYNILRPHSSLNYAFNSFQPQYNLTRYKNTLITLTVIQFQEHHHEKKDNLYIRDSAMPLYFYILFIRNIFLC
jgi:hypothetical protein